MADISFGEATEKWLIEYIQVNGLDGLLVAYIVSIVVAGILGWLISGFTRVADLRKTLAETGKIKGEVGSQKEVLLNSIRVSRDELVVAERLVTNELLELRRRLEKDHNNKADESRDRICDGLTGSYWRALEDHCERVEYLLTRSLRIREICKTIVPSVESACGALDTINNPKLLKLTGDRSPLFLKSSTIYPVLSTIRSICPWWKPWTWKLRRQIKHRFEPHLRKS